MESYGLTGQIIKRYATEIWPFYAYLTYFCVMCVRPKQDAFSS